MPITVFQAGGFRGSTAGDTGAIVGTNWVAGVDLGQSRDGAYMSTQVRTFLNGRLANVHKHLIITHYHDDHGNPGGSRGTLVGDFSDTGAIHDFPTSRRQGPTGYRNTVIEDFDAQRRLTYGNGAYVQRIDGTLARNNSTDLLAVVRHSSAAVQNGQQGDADENKYSGGVYSELRNAQGRPTFGFLSLGDMDPDSAQEGIEEVWTTFFGALQYYPTVLVIKLSHHASIANWSQTMSDVIEFATTPANGPNPHPQQAGGSRVYVLASGHTGAVNQQGQDALRKAVAAGARGAFLLVANNANCRKELGASLRNAWGAIGFRDKLRLLDNATITAGDNGSVSLSGKVWRFQFDGNHLNHTIHADDNATNFDLAAGNDDNGLAGGRPMYGGRSVVLDPAHGGAADAGKSRAYGSRLPDGRYAKDANLELARRIASQLGSDAVLTRDRDENRTLAQRAGTGADPDSDFVSLHASPGGGGVFVHPDAPSSAHRLAAKLRSALGVGAETSELAVLHPDYVGARPACAVTFDPSRLQDTAQALARVLGTRVGSACPPDPA